MLVLATPVVDPGEEGFVEVIFIDEGGDLVDFSDFEVAGY